MTGPGGNSYFVSRVVTEGNIEILGNKLTLSRGTSRKVICYISGNFEAGNSLDLAVTAVVVQHSRITVHCYPLSSQIAMLPAHRFWRETVSLLIVM